MTTYVGGMRDRLIEIAVFDRVQRCLDQLGWLDPDNEYHRPVDLRTEPAAAGEILEPNVVIFTAFDDRNEAIEVGSELEEITRVHYWDIYAEDESVLTHLAGDVRDALRGKFSSLGQTGSHLPVLDINQATPPLAFSVDILNVTNDRVPRANQPWERYWRAVRCEIEDTYDSEDYGSVPLPGPDLLLSPGLALGSGEL